MFRILLVLPLGFEDKFLENVVIACNNTAGIKSEVIGSIAREISEK